MQPKSKVHKGQRYALLEPSICDHCAAIISYRSKLSDDILYDMVDPAYVILHRIGNTTYTPTNRHNGCSADRYYKVLLKRTEGARNAYNKARYVAKKEKQNVLSTRDTGKT